MPIARRNRHDAAALLGAGADQLLHPPLLDDGVGDPAADAGVHEQIVHVAQAARLAGSTKAAEKATLEAQKAIEAVPPDRAMMVDLLGLHARNVRESLKAPKHRALQQRWSAYLDDRIRAGYGFLRYFQ